MGKFDSYTELYLSKNRNDAEHPHFAFWDRKLLWRKAKELNMSVSDMRECEAASSHYEEDKKAAAAAEKTRKAAEKKAAAQKAAAEKKAAEEAAAAERKDAAEKAAAEKAAKEAEKRKAREAILPLAELLEEGLVKFPEGELYIGKTQVTQALWKFITGEEPSHFKGDDRPVESVSIGDCEKFISALNARPEVKKAKFKFRLPTKEEWQCFNRDNGDLSDIGAWMWEDSNFETHSVGQKGKFEMTFDMYGNVSEWCSDGFCMGGNFLSDGANWYPDLFEGDLYDESTRLPIIGLRLVAYKI